MASSSSLSTIFITPCPDYTVSDIRLSRFVSEVLAPVLRRFRLFQRRGGLPGPCPS
ncbi:hypothetical protein HMPREF0239_01413 [Clostridium sp. ATCC BAA-442]|nr:hypothetical protein HMPREF0239_01413 [Clostridium sp. ATCC BAA-442]